jgi:hypothetical protein
MYFAQENDSTKFFVYQSLINNLLKDKKKDGPLRKMLNEIIISTHNLVVGDIEQDDVDHKIYDIVNALADYDKPHTRAFFENIDTEKITEQDYETLSSILSSILSDPTYRY